MPKETQKSHLAQSPETFKHPLQQIKSLGYFSVDSLFKCHNWVEGMGTLLAKSFCQSLTNNSLGHTFPEFQKSELYTLLNAIFKNNLKREVQLTESNFWSTESSKFIFTITPESDAYNQVLICHVVCQKISTNTFEDLYNRLNVEIEKSKSYYTIFEKLTIPSLISRYGIIQHANIALNNLLGIPPNYNVVGLNVLDFIVPEQREEVRRIIEERYEGKEINSPIIHEIIKQNADNITCEIQFTFVELPDGQASVISLHDISEKVKIQNKLVASETKLRQMFESTFVGIFFVDSRGYINEANDRFLQIINYSREEFQKEPIHWEHLTPPEFLEYDYEIMKQLLVQGHINPYEKAFYKSDGSQVPCLITASFLSNKGNNFGAAFIIDLTELKQSKEETLKVVNELSTFLYMASHDLKGPLASTAGLTQLALNEIKDPKALYYLDLIQQCNRKLDNSLSNFMKIIKIKNHVFEKTRIDFHCLINETCSDYKHQTENGQITITSDVEAIPAFYSDEDLIRTIFHNLIENAVKYSNPLRKPSIQITISSCKENIHIQVEDNGKGIDESIKNKIFNIFFRGDTSSKGSGLGLYIVKSAIENLQGSIEVSNKKEGGSIFKVSLPF